MNRIALMVAVVAFVFGTSAGCFSEYGAAGLVINLACAANFYCATSFITSKKTASA